MLRRRRSPLEACYVGAEAQRSRVPKYSRPSRLADSGEFPSRREEWFGHAQLRKHRFSELTFGKAVTDQNLSKVDLLRLRP